MLTRRYIWKESSQSGESILSDQCCFQRYSVFYGTYTWRELMLQCFDGLLNNVLPHKRMRFLVTRVPDLRSNSSNGSYVGIQDKTVIVVETTLEPCLTEQPSLFVPTSGGCLHMQCTNSIHETPCTAVWAAVTCMLGVALVYS